MLLASISDIGVDSNLKLLQAGHFSLYVLSDKIDAHQKQELQRQTKLEKGTIKKEKFWVPKYLADAFDGKVLWLLTGEEETRVKFQYGEEPPAEQYEKDFGSFKTSSYGHNRIWDADKVSVTPERTVGIPTKPENSDENYKNVRDLK